MEIQDFIKHFAEQFDETDVSAFESETKFKELNEWSSIMALNIIAMIDEEYDVSIKAIDIKSSITIQDLFDIVASRV